MFTRIKISFQKRFPISTKGEYLLEIVKLCKFNYDLLISFQQKSSYSIIFESGEYNCMKLFTVNEAVK